MAEALINHECSFYCKGARHAVRALARPHLSREDVQHGYQGYIAPHGWRVVDVRQATEIDVAQWQAEMEWGMYDDGVYRRTNALTQEPAVAWLVIIEPQT